MCSLQPDLVGTARCLRAGYMASVIYKSASDGTCHGDRALNRANARALSSQGGVRGCAAAAGEGGKDSSERRILTATTTCKSSN